MFLGFWEGKAHFEEGNIIEDEVGFIRTVDNSNIVETSIVWDRTYYKDGVVQTFEVPQNSVEEKEFDELHCYSDLYPSEISALEALQIDKKRKRDFLLAEAQEIQTVLNNLERRIKELTFLSSSDISSEEVDVLI